MSLGRRLALVIPTILLFALVASAPAYGGVSFATKWGTLGIAERQFNNPLQIAAGPNNTVDVVDEFNNRVQQFTTSGVFVQTWGWGVSDGAGHFEVCTSSCQAGSSGSGDGQFNTPIGVGADPSGNIYTAESGNSRVQKFDTTPAFLTKWGTVGTSEAQFETPGDSPKGLAVDSSGNVFVVDKENNRIQEFSSTGTFLRMWGYGVSDGSTNALQVCTSSCHAGLAGSGNGEFNNPHGVAIDAAGDVYVADLGNNRIEEFGPPPTLSFIREWGSLGSGVGQFNEPQFVALDSEGNVYVPDYYNNRVQEFTSSGVFVQMWGWGVSDGAGHFEVCAAGQSCRAGSSGTGDGQFTNPIGVAVDSSNSVYITDRTNNRIQKFSVTQPPPGPIIGTLDLDGYCRSLGFVRSQVNGPVVGPNQAFQWQCVSSTGGQTPITMQDACNYQFPSQESVAFAQNVNDANSWVCVAVSGGRLALDALYGPGGVVSLFKGSQRVQRLPNGRSGLAVKTNGSCALALGETPFKGAADQASVARKHKKHRKRKLGLIKRSKTNAIGAGVHLIPIVLTKKGERLVKRLHKRHAAFFAAASKDPIKVTCTPISYPPVRGNGSTAAPNLGASPTTSGPPGSKSGYLPMESVQPPNAIFPPNKTILFKAQDSVGDSFFLTITGGRIQLSQPSKRIPLILRCTKASYGLNGQLVPAVGDYDLDYAAAINGVDVSSGGFTKRLFAHNRPNETLLASGSLTALGGTLIITEQIDPLAALTDLGGRADQGTANAACNNAPGAGSYIVTAQ